MERLVVGRLSQIISTIKHTKVYTEAIIDALRALIPQIPSQYISSQWAAKYQVDATTGDVTDVKEVRLPSIAVIEKSGKQKQMFCGGTVGNENGKAVKGIWKEPVLWIDIWAETNIQRDNYMAYVYRSLTLKKELLNQNGIVNYWVLDERENGFDMGDRILMNHSHQKLRVFRMILVLQLWVRITFPELEEAEGTIEAIHVTLDGDIDATMDIEGAGIPLQTDFASQEELIEI